MSSISSYKIPDHSIIKETLVGITDSVGELARVPAVHKILNSYLQAVEVGSYSEIPHWQNKFQAVNALYTGPQKAAMDKVAGAMQKIQQEMAFVGGEYQSGLKALEKKADQLRTAANAENTTENKLYYLEQARQNTQLSFSHWMAQYVNDFSRAQMDLLSLAEKEDTGFIAQMKITDAYNRLKTAIRDVEKTLLEIQADSKATGVAYPKALAIYQDYKNRLATIDPTGELRSLVTTWKGYLKSYIPIAKNLTQHCLLPFAFYQGSQIALRAGLGYFFGAPGLQVAEAASTYLRGSMFFNSCVGTYQAVKKGDVFAAALSGFFAYSLGSSFYAHSSNLLQKAE